MCLDFIYLASGSPRRRELLQQIGVSFRVIGADCGRNGAGGRGSAGLCVATGGRPRPQAGWERSRERRGARCWRPIPPWCSTGRFWASRSDRNDAEAHAAAAVRPHSRGADRRRLAHRRRARARESAAARSLFERSMPPRRRAYWETGEPRDKAGAYAIQGYAAVFIADLERQLFRRDGIAAVRNRGTAAQRRRCALAVRWADAMSTEILVNASTHEARAAVVENGVLQEVFLERASRRGLISNIYKGRVSRVLARHAGGVHRHRHGAHRFPACLRYFRSAPRGYRH